MYSALTRYGAVTAKVRAMYGRMLKPSEWESIGAMRNLSDISSFIRSHPGWQEAGELIPQGCRDERLIEKSLHTQLENEYERIYRFATREDKRFLIFSVYRTEYRQILSALRHVITRHEVTWNDAPTGFMARKASVRREELEEAETFDDILRAAENTIYASVLKTVPTNEVSGKPDYAAAHVLLENCFYSAVWRYLQKDYKGSAKEILREIYGKEADFLNLTHIMRLRRNFPGSLADIDKLLIPIRWKLTDEFIAQLAGAPTDADAMALLRSSRWAQMFGDDSLTSNVYSYERGMEALCRRSIHAQTPSAAVPQAYLTLKGIECDKLVRAVEAAHYGILPGRVI